MYWLYTKREVTLYIRAQFVPCSLRGDKMCRERLHILSFSGDNVCRVQQNVLLKVHILSPATNCAGATKCAVTGSVDIWWRRSITKSLTLQTANLGNGEKMSCIVRDLNSLGAFVILKNHSRLVESGTIYMIPEKSRINVRHDPSGCSRRNIYLKPLPDRTTE